MSGIRGTLEKYLRKTHPNTSVLDIEELREHLGISPPSTPGDVEQVRTKAPTALGGAVGGRPQLILVGHNFVNDMPILDRHGINLHKHFDLIGIADTQVLVQDSENMRLPQSLAELVLQYQLHPPVYSKRSRKGKGSLIFSGAHNAGNDAIANLQLLMCFMLDSLLDDVDTMGEDDYMADVILPAQNRIDQWISRDMSNINPNLIMMCFDYEGVRGNTSEFGFAWYKMSSLIPIIPGRTGENWWPCLQAKHFLVDRYKNHPGSQYTDGDPLGFWPNFGSTSIYYPKDGLKPFDELFVSITGTTLGGVVPTIALPCVPSHERNIVNTQSQGITLGGVIQAIANLAVVNDSNTGYVPPHKRAIASTQNQDTTLGGVVSSIAIPSVGKDSDTGHVLPHKRAIANDQSQDTTLGGVMSLDHGDKNEDEDDEDEDDVSAQEEYMNLMKLACPDNLVYGKKCRTKADCKGSYFLCPEYSKPPHVCHSDDFVHRAGSVYVLHIKANCKSIQHGGECILGDECTMGHDFPKLRLSLLRWRQREAARNWELNGGEPSEQGNRGGSAGRGRGGKGKNRGRPGRQGSRGGSTDRGRGGSGRGGRGTPR